MTNYTWADTYTKAVELAKGDVPGADLEMRIVEAFQDNPIRVDQAIERIGAQYQRGEIRSFWAVLSKDLEKPAEPRFQATVTVEEKSPWHSTGRRDWERELPPAPRELPTFVTEFMHKHWPNPLEEDAP